MVLQRRTQSVGAGHSSQEVVRQSKAVGRPENRRPCLFPIRCRLGEHCLGVSETAARGPDQIIIVPAQSPSSDIFAAAAPPVALEAPTVPLELKFFRCVGERS